MYIMAKHQTVNYGDFVRMLNDNGYFEIRSRGGHHTFGTDKGKKITVNYNLNKMVARRLVKENKLEAGKLKGFLRL